VFAVDDAACDYTSSSAGPGSTHNASATDTADYPAGKATHASQAATACI